MTWEGYDDPGLIAALREIHPDSVRFGAQARRLLCNAYTADLDTATHKVARALLDRRRGTPPDPAPGCCTANCG